MVISIRSRFALLAVMMCFIYPEYSPAKVMDKSEIISKRGGEESDKDYVLGIKAQIADERSAIIASGQKLRDAKKTGDKALIAKVKAEVDQDVKSRKARIRSLYDDIKARIAQPALVIPGRKDGGR